MKCYRCGYCGQQADEQGNVLALWQVAVLNPFVDWENAEQVQGECCRGEQERQMMQVTREMAMDACEPEMEGMWVEW